MKKDTKLSYSLSYFCSLFPFRGKGVKWGILYLSFFILFAGKSNAQCNTWVPLGVDDTIQASFGSASYTSVSEAAITGALLSYHFVAYSDGMKGGKATVVYPPSSTTWTYLGTEGFSAGQAKYTTVAMGHTYPYVAYQDMANGGKATVMDFAGGAWANLGAAGFSKGTATYDCIAVSRHKPGSDSVYVAYSDGAHHNRLTVLKYSGTGTVWDTVGKAGFSPGAASYISLKLDTLSGTLYVAYSDSANGYKITAYKSNGGNGAIGTWAPVGLATGFSNPRCSFVALNVRGNGIYVAYCDSVQSRKGMAMTYTGGVWSVYGGGTFSKGPVSSIAMATAFISAPSLLSYVVYNDDSLGFANGMKDSANTGWKQCSTPDFSAGRVAYTSMAFVGPGINPAPTVVYQDKRVANKATVMYLPIGTGSSPIWSYAFPPRGISSSYAYTPSIAMNKTAGQPYVAFVNSDTDKERVRVMSYNGSSWATVGGAVSAIHAKAPSLAFNKSGIPYVAYIDGPTGNVYVKNYTGSWSGLPSASGQVTSAISHSVALAFDTANQPYVAFDDGTKAHKSSVEYYNGSSWTILKKSGIDSGASSYVSMAILNSDVYVAFIDASQGNSPGVHQYSAGTWTDLIGPTPDSAAYTSIAVDGSGNIYLAYQDITMSPATVFVYEYIPGTGNWSSITPGSSGLTAGTATGINITLDSLNNLDLSFIDGTQNGKVTVMQYNNAGGTWSTIGSAGISEGTAIQTTQLAISGIVPYVTYQDRGTIVKKFSSAPTNMTITPALSVVCLANNKVNLTVHNGGTSYSWSPASGSASTISVSPTSTTTYTVTSSLGGCPVTATAIVDVSTTGDDIFTVAGSGNYAYNGDGASALASSMELTTGLVFDSTYNNMYIADQQNAVIRKVNMATNIITTIAGSNIVGPGYAGDGYAATTALLNWPSGLAIYHNNLYIADQANSVIRKVNLKTGIITTVAGDGTATYGGDGGQATAAQLNFPTGIAFDSKGIMYIADANNSKIREVNLTTGVINTFAGNGIAGYAGDGLSINPQNIELNIPTSVAIDASNNVYIADKNNNRIRKITPPVLLLSGVSTVAGNGTQGYSGDGLQATAAELYHPVGIAIDATTGNLFISDADNNVIRRVITSSGIINTIAGKQSLGSGYSGDGGPAIAADLNLPWAVAFDAAGDIFIPDNFNNRVREVKICSAGSITVKASKDTVCAGTATKLTASGGASYTWSSTAGGGLSSLSGNPVTATPTTTSTYTVSDGSTTATIVITVLPGPIASISGSTSICNGVNDTINFATSNTASYIWSPGKSIADSNFSTSPYYIIVTPTVNTTYTLTMANSNGCKAKDSIKVSVGTPTLSVVASPTSICRGSADTLTATGATAYTWTSPAGGGLVSTTGSPVIAIPTATTSTIVYSVTGIATGGCSANGTVTVTIRPKPTVNASANPTSICLGNSTSLSATGAGSYSWDGGATTTAAVTVTPSATSTYTVIGITSVGCSDTSTVAVTVTNAFTVSVTDTNVTCNGYCNGSATAVTSTPGTYTYLWNNGKATSHIGNLCPGNDTVTVKNTGTGCIGIAVTTITQPATLRDSIVRSVNELCVGGNTGSATDTVLGGTGPYTYFWKPNGGNLSSANSLPAGIDTVSTTDANGCTATATVNITQPGPVRDSIAKFTNAKCNGTASGTATVGVKGGSGSFTYTWSTTPAQTTSVATALSTGTYTVTIIDNNCGGSYTATVSISEPPPIVIDSVGGIKGEKCYGGKTGSATIYASGGTPGYTYSWPGGQTTSAATTLGGGVNTFSVTDKNGCAILDTVTIPQPPPILIHRTDTTICPGTFANLNAAASGGASPYGYTWSNLVNGSINNVNPAATTIYSVKVTDANGCSNTRFDTVTVAAQMVQGTITTPAGACAGSSFSLSDAVTGGTGSISYTWQPGNISGSTINVSPGSTTTYTVVASDGCASSNLTANVTVTVYPIPSFSVCCDTTIISGQGAQLVANPSSGYNYVWTPSAGLSCNSCPNPVASPTANTEYTITVTANGCTTVDSVDIQVSGGKIVIYNGITPNGDGNNDTWVIDNIDLYPNNSVAIFNRWGIEVWSGNGYNNSTVLWKGDNSSGQPLPDATYFYVIKVDGVTYKGWVQLTR